MKIALYSDLHREIGLIAWQPPPLNVDLVILAGDIDSHSDGIEWAARTFRNVPGIVYVAGNHEYYDTNLGLLSELQEPVWETMGVHFLEKRSVELDGVRVLGCSAWSGFDLYGSETAGEAMKAAQRWINDYRMIRTKEGRILTTADTRKLHRSAVLWLEKTLAQPFAGRTVVVTHFAPHRGCVAPEHQGSPVSPYFVTDLSRLMTSYPIALWCFGHTHTNIDFIAENGCRVISNQLGYPAERSESGNGTTIDNGFRRELVIEI